MTPTSLLQRLDTPPVITLFFIILGILICIFTYIYLVTRTYRCPSCGHTFKPKWNEISVTIHLGDERVVRCPRCGRKGFCPRER